MRVLQSGSTRIDPLGLAHYCSVEYLVIIGLGANAESHEIYSQLWEQCIIWAVTGDSFDGITRHTQKASRIVCRNDSYCFIKFTR